MVVFKNDPPVVGDVGCQSPPVPLQGGARSALRVSVALGLARQLLSLLAEIEADSLRSARSRKKNTTRRFHRERKAHHNTE